jgi:hypothetical protein
MPHTCFSPRRNATGREAACCARLRTLLYMQRPTRPHVRSQAQHSTPARQHYACTLRHTGGCTPTAAGGCILSSGTLRHADWRTADCRRPVRGRLSRSRGGVRAPLHTMTATLCEPLSPLPPRRAQERPAINGPPLHGALRLHSFTHRTFRSVAPRSLAQERKKERPSKERKKDQARATEPPLAHATLPDLSATCRRLGPRPDPLLRATPPGPARPAASSNEDLGVPSHGRAKQAHRACLPAVPAPLRPRTVAP